MSARTGLLRGLCLHHVSCSAKQLQQQQQQQRRLLNHFISRDPTPAVKGQDAPSPPQFTLAVKDNIATTGATASSTTTCASPFLTSYRSPFEATIVTQLRARGAVVVGKTNLDEFGMGSHSVHSAFGPVAQGPDDDQGQGQQVCASGDYEGEARSAGGSSGGSAVAVACGEADMALGTDTGGSVRLPAAYTGVVGFKPSYGMLSRHGVVPYANSLDTVGLLARSVGTIADLLVGAGGLWAEHDPKDPTSLSPAARARCASGREGYRSSLTAVLKGVRFGIPLECNIEELDPRIRDAWSASAEALQQLGARIVPVSLPSTRHALAAYYVIAPAEASSNLAKYDGIRYGTREDHGGSAGAEIESDAADGGVLYAASRGRGFGDEVKRRILLGSYTLSSEAMDNYFIKAQAVRRLVRRDFDRVFALANPLHEPEAFDLSDLPDSVAMENKFGPTEVDFLLCPTAPTLAPRLADVAAQQQSPVDSYMNDVFTVPASLAGLPAISIPVQVAPEAAEGPGRETGSGAAGLQLIGQFWDDARLLAVAGAVARALSEPT
ncbi:amidase signature domain-containing protein [Lasiosphaeria ovina]|uniref:Glutamyl-tRNA(Gln) amidotransferase subunit A, mitochondrial n=1 Tax=Lasiosphaeria ovina TaxID=92902 RepID=A0AAE0N025_9PEZI|nr:amidase signature domain-containing protein [Lasiosphaeria ovina]